MSRFQLSMNVADVDESVEFYSKLFGVGPAKHREGYANFVVADPPLKLVLIEDEGGPGTINHLGIELESSDEVASRAGALEATGLPIVLEEPHTCCFATQDKAWTRDADGVLWEVYTVIADADQFGTSPRDTESVDALLPPVSLDELRAAVDDPDVVVIDAQDDAGFHAAHIDGAVHFGFDGVADQAAAEIGHVDRRVIVYCSDLACLGSEFVGTLLVQAGYTNVGRFPDGLAAWREAGLPTVSNPVATASDS